MLDDLQRQSVEFRFDKAKCCLKASETLLETEAYADSANRSYYAIYHALRAVLVTIGFYAKSHSGNIAEFRRRFIKTEVFPKSFSDIIGNAFDIRHDSDYEDFYVISKDDVSKQLENAKVFLAAIETYLQNF